MKFILKLLFFIILILGCGCIGKRFYLSVDEITWNPYQPGDKLIFKSDNAEIDTIIILDVKSKKFPDAPIKLKYYNERLSVTFNHSDPEYNRKMVNTLLYIEAATPADSSMITFQFFLKGAEFKIKRIGIYELEKRGYQKLYTSAGLFEDVVKIEGPCDVGLDSLSLSYIYWSKRFGIIRFETCRSKVWELQNEIYRTNL